MWNGGLLTLREPLQSGRKTSGCILNSYPSSRGDLRFVRVLSIREDSGTTQTSVKEFLRCLRSGPERKEARKDRILEPGLERKTDSWKEEQQKDAPPYEHFTALGKIVYYKFFFTSRH